jgi:hypothetical protein
VGRELETAVASPVGIDSVEYVLAPKHLFKIASTVFKDSGPELIELGYRRARVNAYVSKPEGNFTFYSQEMLEFDGIPDAESAVIQILEERDCIIKPEEELKPRWGIKMSKREPKNIEFWMAGVRLPTFDEIQKRKT